MCIYHGDLVSLIAIDPVFSSKSETLVPARVAEPPAGAEDSGGFGGGPPADFAHNPGNFARRVPASYHAYNQVRDFQPAANDWSRNYRRASICHQHQTDPGRAEIDPGQRDAFGKLAHYRREDAGGGSSGRDIPDALRILRVDHSTSSGKPSR